MAHVSAPAAAKRRISPEPIVPVLPVTTIKSRSARHFHVNAAVTRERVRGDRFDHPQRLECAGAYTPPGTQSPQLPEVLVERHGLGVHPASTLLLRRRR